MFWTPRQSISLNQSIKYRSDICTDTGAPSALALTSCAAPMIQQATKKALAADPRFCPRPSRLAVGHVRFGSAADIEVATRLVRFVPKADFDYREILLRLDLPPSAAAESDAEC